MASEALSHQAIGGTIKVQNAEHLDSFLRWEGVSGIRCGRTGVGLIVVL